MMTSLLATTLLSAALTAPAPPTVLAADVQLAWTTDGKIRISWNETTPAPNTVVLERPGGEDLPLASPSVAEPNTVVLEPAKLEPYGPTVDRARIVVSEPGGDLAPSADFDRYRRGAAQAQLSYRPNGDMAWSVPPDPVVDSTPNDPLDVTTPTTYGLRLMTGEQPWTYDKCRVEYTARSTALSGVITKQRPMDVTFLAWNEWGAAQLDWRWAFSSVVTLNAPASTPYGATATLTGKIATRRIFENPKPPNDALPICLEEDAGARANTTVVLQARDSATGGWYVVGSGKTDAAGNYNFPLRNSGAREYRTTVAGTTGTTPVQPATSPARTVRASTRVVSAKFIQPSVTVGTRPQAYLWVDPAGTQKAALQFKNSAGAWQGLTYKTLYAGRGLVAFAWNTRGTFQFRWWVPGSTTSTRLPVDAVYSGPFTLKVS
ncbi:hypothetical protein [Kribbella sp. ALI-6-A]|uniref:hypothetical protein n=1 Tax=Kribbella sp. ALI-6-A TaxID=1933817 RepID=UPI000A013413|nr:hypothetical protein [Kribbella sp. ALI-6-A]